MKLLPLILRNLTRKPLRTICTGFAIFVAFWLFTYLAAVDAAFRLGVDVLGADRLATRHKVSLFQLLPESYGPRIEQLEGVGGVAHMTWFGGVYRDRKNFFPQMAAQDNLFEIYPEFVVPPEQLAAWKANRTGAIVGRATAERYGFEVGDRVPILGALWRPSQGNTWYFDIEGIYEGNKDGVDESNFLFHYDYFDEARDRSQGEVGWYILTIDDVDRSVALSAEIDALFANSSAETKTSTEKAWAQSFANQIGNIGAILRYVMSAVFFTILLVAGNTMAQAVRERFSELGVLKTLGFTDRALFGLVLGESTLLAGIGGLGGLVTGWTLITTLGDPTGGILASFFLPPIALIQGAVLVLLLGLVTGLIPAIQALRLPIVEALRRG